jgi:folate-binding protein YgfZ
VTPSISVPTGYEALRSGAAWLDLSARGKIKASGEDRARLLHAMSTNHIQQLTPGTGCYAYFLTAQGRVLADVNILTRPDHFLLDTEPEAREKIFKHLDTFIIADDVTIEDLTDSLATIAIEGPQAATILERLGAPLPGGDYENAEWQSSLVVRASHTGGPGFFVITPASERAALIDQLEAAGAVAASPEAFRIVRIENGRPRFGEDITERFIAPETNQARAMNYQKGCYLGQEIVERVRSRGQVNRILVSIQIEGVELPEPGTKLQLGNAVAGEITSVAYSPALNKVMGLAYVRVEHANAGEELSVNDRRVSVAAPGSMLRESSE